MAQTIASLEAKIGADLSGLDAGLRKAQQQLQRAAGDFKHAGMALTVGITVPVVGAGLALAKLAMDATESENLFTVAMGDMEAAGRAWSKQLKEDLGISEYNARKFLGTVNMMFTGMGLGEKAAFDMSKGIAQLAYDLASIYNVSVEEAFTRLQSGLAGEIEPMRRWGVTISEAKVEQYALAHGINTTGRELSDQEKVWARYGVIMEQTTKQQGDLARTIDSPANRLRILQERFHDAAIEVGNVFLPTATDALTWLADIGLPTAVQGVNQFRDSWPEMSDEAKRNIIGVATLLVAGGPLMQGIGIGIQGVGMLIGAFGLLPNRVKIAVAGALLAMLPLKDNLAGILEDAAKELETIHARPDLAAQYRASAAELRKPVHEIVGDLAGDLAKATKDAAIDALLGKLGDLKGNFEAWLPPLVKFNKEMDTGAMSAAELQARIKATGQSMIPPPPPGISAPAKAKKEVDELKAAADAAGLSTRELTDYLVAQSEPAKAAASAVSMLELRLVGLKDQQEAVSDAQRAGQDALRGMQDRVSELSGSLSEAKARLQDLANPRLVGMQKFDDTLFSIEQSINRLQLQKLMLTPGVSSAGIDKQIAELQRQQEIARLQQGLAFDDPLRKLKAAAEGAAKELTFAEALAQIGTTKGQIAGLTGELSAAQAAVKGQEQALRAMENASYLLSKQTQQLQADLALQKERQDLVNTSLGTAFTWLLEDRKKVEELGPAAVASATIVDEQTRKLLEATRVYAQGEAGAAITAIQAALGEYNRAKAEMAAGLTIRVTKVEETVSAPPAASGLPYAGEYAGGGIVPGPVGRPYLATVHGGEAIGGGGSTLVVNVTVQGSVTSEGDLVRAVRDGLVQLGRRNGTTGIV